MEEQHADPRTFWVSKSRTGCSFELFRSPKKTQSKPRSTPIPKTAGTLRCCGEYLYSAHPCGRASMRLPIHGAALSSAASLIPVALRSGHPACISSPASCSCRRLCPSSPLLTVPSEMVWNRWRNRHFERNARYLPCLFQQLTRCQGLTLRVREGSLRE